MFYVRLPVWKMAFHLAAVGYVLDGVSFYGVLFPTRCLG